MTRKLFILSLLAIFFLFPSYALADEGVVLDDQHLSLVDLMKADDNPYLAKEDMADDAYLLDIENNIEVLAQDITALQCHFPKSEDKSLFPGVFAEEEQGELLQEDPLAAADALLQETADNNAYLLDVFTEESNDCLDLKAKALPFYIEKEAANILEEREVYAKTFFSSQLLALESFFQSEKEKIVTAALKERSVILKEYKKAKAELRALLQGNYISFSRFQKANAVFENDFKRALANLQEEKREGIASLQRNLRKDLQNTKAEEKDYLLRAEKDYQALTSDSENLADVVVHNESIALDDSLVASSKEAVASLEDTIADNVLVDAGLDPDSVEVESIISESEDIVEDRNLEPLRPRTQKQRQRAAYCSLYPLACSSQAATRAKQENTSAEKFRNNNQGGGKPKPVKPKKSPKDPCKKNPQGCQGSPPPSGPSAPPVSTSYTPVSSGVARKVKSAKEKRRDNMKKARKQAKKALQTLDARLGRMSGKKFSAFLKKGNLSLATKALLRAKRQAAKLQYEKAAYLKAEKLNIKITSQILSLEKQLENSKKTVTSVTEKLPVLQDKVADLQNDLSKASEACSQDGEDCQKITTTGSQLASASAKAERLEGEKVARETAVLTLEEQKSKLNLRKEKLDKKISKRFLNLQKKALLPLEKLFKDKALWQKVQKSVGPSFQKSVKKIYLKTKTKHKTFTASRTRCQDSQCSKETAVLFYIKSKARGKGVSELPRRGEKIRLPNKAKKSLRKNKSKKIASAKKYKKQQATKLAKLKKNKKKAALKNTGLPVLEGDGTKAEEIFNAKPAVEKEKVLHSLNNPYAKGDLGEDNPSAVAIKIADNLCAGVVVDPRWIITAAHCVYSDKEKKILHKKKAIKAIISQTVISSPEYSDISQVIPHPNYSAQEREFDVALLKLKKATDAPALKIADLQNEEIVKTGAQGTISGWGIPCKGCPPSSSISVRAVEIADKDECALLYRGAKPSLAISSNMICAKAVARDACTGDSGGPLLVDVSGRKEILGLVSFGVGCNAKKYPGVYAYLPGMTDWISENVVKGLSGKKKLTLKRQGKASKKRALVVKNETLLPVAIEKIRIKDNENKVFLIKKSTCPETLNASERCRVVIAYRGKEKENKASLLIKGKKGNLLSADLLGSFLPKKAKK
jgi:trypsin